MKRSFADYFNPHNTNFGALRVMNDDLVKPGSGFGCVAAMFTTTRSTVYMYGTNTAFRDSKQQLRIGAFTYIS